MVDTGQTTPSARMESQETSTKCSPWLLRPGKKFLFLLVTLNLFILWLFYNKSSDLLYFGYSAKKSFVNATEISLTNISTFHVPLLGLKDMAPYYTEVNTNVWCFFQGTDLKESKRRSKCICVNKWYGLDCGIPIAVWNSSYLQRGENRGVEIRRRKFPRRIIASIVIDEQLDILDINIRDTFALIDIFLIGERENYLPSLSEEFKSGFLSGFQKKIMLIKVKLNIQPRNEEDWISQMLQQLWITGWERLSDFRPDDIFLFSYVSSIISKDVILFLKLYDGYPEPFLFELRPLLFQFQNEIVSNISIKKRFVPFKSFGCTFQYIASFCRYDMLKLFTDSCNVSGQQQKNYERNFWKVKVWTIGNDFIPSGWHCNLCCRNNCIRNILKQRKHFGNFSDYIPVIKNFLKKQIWFDSKEFTIKKVISTDSFIAPDTVTKNVYKYSYLFQ